MNFQKKVCFSRKSRLKVALTNSLVMLYILLCYCRYFDETFTAMLLVFIVLVILGHNLGNSQVSLYRTIGPTLVFSSPEPKAHR